MSPESFGRIVQKACDGRAIAPPPTHVLASSDGSARTARGACACPAACTAPARSPSSAAATKATPDSTATNVNIPATSFYELAKPQLVSG